MQSKWLILPFLYNLRYRLFKLKAGCWFYLDIPEVLLKTIYVILKVTYVRGPNQKLILSLTFLCTPYLVQEERLTFFSIYFLFSNHF